MRSDFLSNYINLAIDCSGNDYHDNHDEWRFGPNSPLSEYKLGWLKNLYPNLLKKLKLINECELKKIINMAVNYIAPNIINFEWLYENLFDDESRKLMVQLQLFRVLGQRRVKLPLNSKDYWFNIEVVKKLANGAESLELGFMGWKAYKMNFDSLGYPLQLFLCLGGVIPALILQQYRCHTSDKIIEVEEGDIVIDGGGCYGETALYFALKAGTTGQVFSFEFMPENLSIFHKNMELNLDVAKRVMLIEKPLWNNSGEILYIESNGPGSRVSPDTTDLNARKINTISIDDLVREKGLNKLDFIKMDIEGSELQALIGAEKSIRRYRPKLAISIYHKPEDFWTIPQFIAGLDLGYRFAIRHFTIYQEETVLFAF